MISVALFGWAKYKLHTHCTHEFHNNSKLCRHKTNTHKNQRACKHSILSAAHTFHEYIQNIFVVKRMRRCRWFVRRIFQPMRFSMNSFTFSLSLSVTFSCLYYYQLSGFLLLVFENFDWFFFCGHSINDRIVTHLCIQVAAICVMLLQQEKVVINYEWSDESSTSNIVGKRTLQSWIRDRARARSF